MNPRLEMLRRRLGQDGSVRRGIQPRSTLETAPLSASQHRMWLHQKLHPASSAYNVCIRMDLSGELDERRLQAALVDLVDRHEVLRTTYPTDGEGRPFQRIHPRMAVPMRVIEGGDPAQVAAQAAGEPFDLAHSSPIRFQLVRVDIARWSLILAVHHIVWDGGCFGIFSRDLSFAYRGDAGVPPLPIQYADVAAHEAGADHAASARRDAQIAHWRDTLAPPPPALPLPCERPQAPDIGEGAHRVDRMMAAACVKGLATLAAALRTTPFTVFVAAYAILLRRWTGASDITIGTMVANRHGPGTRDLIGNFGNTVLLRLDLSGDPTFRQLVDRGTRTVRDALANADVPFERVVEELAPAREPGHGFFTDTLGLFLDRDIEGPNLPGVDVRWSNVFNSASPFALTFQGFMSGGELRVEATYRSELFAPTTVQRMLDHLEAILLAASDDPDRLCSGVDELPRDQRHRLALLSCGAEVDRPVETVLGRWRRRVAATPERLALVCGSDRFSYAEVDAHADRLADRLIAGGVRAEDVVGVAVGRSVTTVAAPLAIWKCGAVFLPLDRTHPRSRLRDLLAEAGARLLVCDPGTDVGSIPEIVTEASAEVAQQAASDPGCRPDLRDAAHITFTSGSTGRPKGVVTTHGSLAARTSWVATHWPAGGARLARSVPTAIDATAELCEAFVTGEYLVLATDGEARDAAALAALLKRHGIGHVMTVPGLLEAVATTAADVVADRDRVLSTGEPLLPRVARAIHATAPGVPLHNAYGCSETTGDVACGRIDAADAEADIVAIGHPLPGSGCHVLASDLRPAPQGVLGELYVDGPQLARGYLRRPALTAARFVAHPFRTGERIYRTGDLVRLRADGRLELCGRSDDQVNVRGHRVEASETAAALHALPQVREAVVLPHTVGTSTELVAYVAGDGLGPEDGPRIRETLAGRLPGPLVPGKIVVMPRLPRLEGGKIDRQALPKDMALRVSSSRQPRDAREATLARLLGEVLDREPVGIDDNFFEIGGDSLLAVTFAARAGVLGIVFPAAAVFQFPTVAQIAGQLAPPREQPAKSLPLAARLHRFRLSDVPVADFVTWHALAHPLPPARLRRALADTISRHTALRRTILARGRLWRSQLPPGGPDAVDVIELPRVDAAGAIEAGRSVIDMAGGRTIAAVSTPDFSVLVAHPAAVDGLSLARVVREVEARSRGSDVPSTNPSTPEATPLPKSHWDAIMRAGPDSPWWIAPDGITPIGPYEGVRAVADAAYDAQVTATFLQALRTLSGNDLVSADIEVDADEIGPLVAVPFAGREDPGTAFADGRSYVAYQATQRPMAGGPGVLLRRTLSPDHGQPEAIARGASRLYHIAAAWQRSGPRIDIEVTATRSAGIAEALAGAWKAALDDLGR